MVQAHLAALTPYLSSLETVLRLQEGLDELPTTLRQPTLMLLEQGVNPEEGLAALRKGVLQDRLPVTSVGILSYTAWMRRGFSESLNGIAR